MNIVCCAWLYKEVCIHNSVGLLIQPHIWSLILLKGCDKKLWNIYFWQKKFAIGSSIKTDCYAIHCSVVLYRCLVRIINTLKQDVWISSYKHIDPSWPHILKPIHLQQSNHRFRYPLCFFSSLLSVQTMAFMKDDDILCEFYAYTYSDFWCL